MSDNDPAYAQELAAAAVSNDGPVELTKDAKTWGMLCHLSALAGLIVPSLGHWGGPLLVWLIKRNDHPFIDAQGKEILNFEISMTIYVMVALLLCLVFVGFILLIVMIPVALICPVIAAVQASEGKSYRYPFTIRFIK